MLDPSPESDTLAGYNGIQPPRLKAHGGEALKETLSREAKAGFAKSVSHAVSPSGTDSDCD